MHKANIIALEVRTESAYCHQMDDNPALAPAGWLEALAASEAQLAAGQIVDDFGRTAGR